jgi:hypothetical protein
MGIEPTPSAWKAEVLPLNYTRLVEGGGFEPPKAEPTDLQSAPFGRSGTPPKKSIRPVAALNFKASAKKRAILRNCPPSVNSNR